MMTRNPESNILNVLSELSTGDIMIRGMALLAATIVRTSIAPQHGNYEMIASDVEKMALRFETHLRRES